MLDLDPIHPLLALLASSPRRARRPPLPVWEVWVTGQLPVTVSAADPEGAALAWLLKLPKGGKRAIYDGGNDLTLNVLGGGRTETVRPRLRMMFEVEFPGWRSLGVPYPLPSEDDEDEDP